MPEAIRVRRADRQGGCRRNRDLPGGELRQAGEV